MTSAPWLQRIDPWSVAGWFACMLILSLPFAHSAALRNVSLGIALLALIAGWRRIAPPRIPLLWLLGAWALLGLMSLVRAVDRDYSGSELYTELRSILVFILFFALANAIWLQRFRVAFLVATALAFLSALYWQLFLHWGSTGAFFNGPGMYSTFLIAVYPFALTWMLWRSATRDERLLHAAIVVSILAGGAITQNRMFWIVVALQTVVIVIALQGKSTSWVALGRRAAVALAAVVVFGGALYGISSTRYKLDPTSPDAVAETITSDIRRGIWQHAVTRIAQSPIVGYGFGRGSLRQEFREKFGGGLYWHAHNVLLNAGLSMGVAGIVVVFLLFAAMYRLLRAAWRGADAALRPYAIAATVMVIGMFAKNMSDDLFYRQTVLIYFAMAGMVLGAAARAQRVAAASDRPARNEIARAC
jgi:O-antigen ligase